MIKKFEAFKTTDIKSNDVYLKKYMDGERPERITKDLGLADEKLKALEDIKLEIKKLSWKSLIPKKSGSMFANLTITFELPETITNKLKELDPKLYKETLGTKKLQMQIEASNHNRTHIEAIPSFLRGLGLGFKMYKAVIKRLGYITTLGDASPSAKTVWSNLIQDPDFYAILADDGAILIDKKWDKERTEEVIIAYLRDYYGIDIKYKIDRNTRDKFHMDNNPIKVDPELARTFNHLRLGRLDTDVFKRYDKMKDKIDYDNYEK